MQSNRSLKIGILVALKLAVIAAVATVVLVSCGNNTNPEYAVKLNIDFGDYNSETYTRIPVQISGQDLNDETVNQTFFVAPGDDIIILKSGSYTLNIPASTLCEQGYLYNLPAAINFEIPKDLEANADYDGIASQALKFTKMDEANVTDSLIEEAAKIASQDSKSSGKVESYKQASIKLKEDYVKKQQLEADKKAGKVLTGTVYYGSVKDILPKTPFSSVLSKVHFNDSDNDNAYLILDEPIRMIDGVVVNSPNSYRVQYIELGINELADKRESCAKWAQYNNKHVTLRLTSYPIETPKANFSIQTCDAYLYDAEVIDVG